MNYLVKCESLRCDTNFIKNRGLENPIIEPARDLPIIQCPTCHEELYNFSSIKLFILKDSKGSINFRSDNIQRSVPFDIKKNQLLFFLYL